MNIKMLAGGLLAAALMAVTPAVASDSCNQNFTLVNDTGYSIREVYVSPTRVSDWQEDVMGSDVLDAGQSVDISFQRDARAHHWDLKVVYDDDDSTAVWTNFDLCTISEITLSYNRHSGKTWAHWK